MSRRRASDAVWNTRKPLNFERYDPREPTGALTVFGGKAIIGGTFGLLCMALFSSRNFVSQRPDHSLAGPEASISLIECTRFSSTRNQKPSTADSSVLVGHPRGGRVKPSLLGFRSPRTRVTEGLSREKVNITSKRPLIAPRYKSLHLFGQ